VLTDRNDSRSVLIAFDDSESGKDALALGRVLAEVLDAKPIAVTVIRFPTYLEGIADHSAVLEESAGDRMRAAADNLKALEPDVRGLLDESPGRALHDLIEAEKPILAVVGPTHRGPIGHLAPGTTAAALVHGAPCAVAVAPSGYRDRSETHLLSIGVAVDHGDEAHCALEAAVGLARRLHAKLTLLTVAEPLSFPYGSAYSTLSAGAYAAAIRDAHERTLDQAAESVPYGVPFERLQLEGPVAPSLAEAGEELDLLVMGSRGYGPVRRVLLGSVSAPVIEQARCPVLIVSREAGANPLRFPELAGGAFMRERETSELSQ
jgi:nucleotide-binding universal stress UspA family protein